MSGRAGADGCRAGCSQGPWLTPITHFVLFLFFFVLLFLLFSFRKQKHSVVDNTTQPG